MDAVRPQDLRFPRGLTTALCRALAARPRQDRRRRRNNYGRDLDELDHTMGLGQHVGRKQRDDDDEREDKKVSDH